MRSLTVKLSLAFLAVSLTGAVLVAVFAQLAAVTAFDSFVLEQAQSDFISQAEAFFQLNQTWDGVREAFHRPDQSPQPLPPGSGQQPALPPNLFVLVDRMGYVRLPGGGFRIGDRVPPGALASGIGIEVEGEVVGTVLTIEPRPDRDPNEQRYVERTNRAVLLAALGGTAIALVLGILLARTLTRPIRELTTAIRDMAKGRLQQQVPIRTRDELGELAEAFNEMSADLARSDDLRRQMTADIAHDLRTPLTVITGYLESLRDGVLEPTPERLDAIYGEAQHLFHLIQDLRTLSLADAGELPLQRQSILPSDLLQRVTTAYAHQAERQKVALRLTSEGNMPEIDIDLERMVQVLGNLISNALRHTPEGGQITLSAAREEDVMRLTVADNGEGIPSNVVPKVFDRFYRGETSRQRKDGETGLGLAIAKSIIEAHGGSITVDSEIGKGTTFTIILPAKI
jgi:signal transduction histidine kinase